MPLQNIVPADYAAQLADKVASFKLAFAPFGVPEPTVFASEPLHYRLRAEFRMLHDKGRLDYAMFAAADPKVPVAIDTFPAADRSICDLMPRLRERLQASNTLKDGLYQVNFLATLSGRMLVTLIYHHSLGKRWEAASQGLAGDLGIQLIGRSRGQKVVLENDWLLEEFELDGRQLRYQQIEGAFTQPNGALNRRMLAWACQQATGLGGDLLELYCGNGNFTVALAPHFGRVLATEVNTASVKAAQYNLAANEITNVAVARLASEDISAALAGKEVRSKMPDLDFGQYQFSTLFVDPPRSGLDAETLALAAGFRHILYISCNPQTLQENVDALKATHEITAAALFDQFPYTHHLESGLLLTRR
ncbi:MAG: tRNA (uridine(54)-C5)-methyltransferase TrmA [Bacteroidota bacterium]